LLSKVHGKPITPPWQHGLFQFRRPPADDVARAATSLGEKASNPNISDIAYLAFRCVQLRDQTGIVDSEKICFLSMLPSPH
jgi:hypothetical protein